MGLTLTLSYIYVYQYVQLGNLNQNYLYLVSLLPYHNCKGIFNSLFIENIKSKDLNKNLFWEWSGLLKLNSFYDYCR